MKVDIVLKIARQVEGEMVFINAIAAFADKQKLMNFMSSTKFMPAEKVNDIDCTIEIGVLQDVEITE